MSIIIYDNILNWVQVKLKSFELWLKLNPNWLWITKTKVLKMIVSNWFKLIPIKVLKMIVPS